MSKGTPQTPAAGKYIPIPADFPVSWENPGDAKLTWMLNTRSKTPMEPLTYAIAAAFTEGGNPGYERAGLPFQMRVARINTYEYMGVKMTAAPPDAVMKAMGLLSRAAPGMFKMMMNKVTADMSKQQLDAISPIVARFDEYWYDELLPEIKQHIAYFESCNLRGMSLNQLRAHLAEALRRVERMGALHMLAVLPGFFAMSQFEELYAELFEGASTLDALQLLQGFDNKTIEADRALWQLSRTALASPVVKEVLTNCSARDVLSALENTVQGRRFLATLQTWLHQYGQRLSSVFALLEPDWIEDPTVVIEYLKAYVAQPDAGRETDQAARVAEREKAVVDARARLTSYPQPVRDQFETLLKAAQTAAVVHEDHNYWIDQRLFYHVRQLILEFGRRFAETGALDAVDDVFYVTPEELHESREILAGQGEEKAQNRSLQQCVRERKAEMEHYSRVTAPPMLGTMPPFEMDDGGPVLRAFFKGDFNPQENGSSDPGVVNGLAGSAGIVRGKARVIRSLAEAGKLQKWDILVTEFTVPPWTPLFAIAGAIVTDIGGVLSHSAVVAREYRIPAVVGTGHATTTFHDGQLLEVDGNAGMVRAVASA